MARLLRFALFFGILLVSTALLQSATGNSSKSSANTILITFDSLRADRLALSGGKRVTPNLDSLAKQSIVFTRAYAQSPLTVGSSATILSGTYPQTHHASELGKPISSTVPFLPAVLHAHQYRTAAFVSSIQLDPRNGFAPGFDRGFDLYSAGLRLPGTGVDRYHSVRRRPEEVVADAIRWIGANSSQPFFVWIHLDTSEDSSDGESYNKSLEAEDLALGKLLGDLRAKQLYDQSLIVLTAAHGQSLGAHGEDTHGIFLYDETIHVPLLLKLPSGRLAGKQVKGQVRLLDVAPTVLEVAHVPIPSGIQGQSLLRIATTNPDSDEPAYASGSLSQQGFGWSPLESWRQGKYLFIHAPVPELYDLSADPEAKNNLAQKSKATLAVMAYSLDALDRNIGQKSGKNESVGLNTSEIQKLASLGYVGISRPTPASETALRGTDPKEAIELANRTLHAWSLLDNGKTTAAIPAFRAIASAQPNIFLVQWGLGLAYFNDRQYPEAIASLRKAIESKPNFAWAHEEMGRSLMKLNENNAAVVHLEIASRLMPNCPEMRSALAEVYQRLGRKADANR
jgi:choline-sulfatase